VKILVAVKRVPITGGKMVLTDDEQSIQTRHLGFTISPHEECGVEEAVRIAEALSEKGERGEVVVLTLGPPEAEEQLRECMALGADRAIHLVSEEEWDAQATASALTEAIRAEEPIDLIVFGNESADAANYQVGIRIAYALGLPVVTGVKGLTVADGRARCEQETAGGRDVYDVVLPAIVTVKEGLNLPRYPSVPAKLRANRKPVDAKPVERPASKLEKLRLVVPAGQGKQAEVLGHGPDAASAVVEVMQKLGVA
jgi:electron transfer flavoprotein beta subunit